jgi:hypothetical protein
MFPATVIPATIGTHELSGLVPLGEGSSVKDHLEEDYFRVDKARLISNYKDQIHYRNPR